MKEIIRFLRKRQGIKYSILVLIFGLIFTFSFQANRAQISQIPREPFKIDLGTKETKKYLMSGWSSDQRWGETTVVKATKEVSSLAVPLSPEETYRLTIKAFSSTPQGVPNQTIDVYFNDIALSGFEFKKNTKWQKFQVTIPQYLIFKENTLKLSYSEEISLSPVVFDHLKFKNYVARLHKGITLYLLYDPPTLRKPTLRKPEEPSLFLRLFFEPVSRPPSKEFFLQPKVKAFGFSLAFIILLWIVWLLSSRFLYLRTKLELSRLLRLDLLTYLPGLILLLLLALTSFFSKYYTVYSSMTFFILSVAPTAMAKVWLIYSKSKFLAVVNRSIKSLIEFIEPGNKRIFLDVGAKKVSSFVACTYQKIRILRRLLIEYHRKDRSSAFIVDFMLLLILCALLLIMGVSFIAEGLAVIAYFLLFIAIVMKAMQFFREDKKGRKE